MKEQKLINLLCAFLLFILLFVCSSCTEKSTEDVKVSYIDQNQITGLSQDSDGNFYNMEKNYIQFSTTPNQGKQFVLLCDITNNTNTLVSFGDCFIIDYHLNGSWVRLDIEKGDFTTQMNSVDPNQSYHFTINLEDYFYSLSNGDYRLSKETICDSEIITIYSYFSINK